MSNDNTNFETRWAVLKNGWKTIATILGDGRVKTFTLTEWIPDYGLPTKTPDDKFVVALCDEAMIEAWGDNVSFQVSKKNTPIYDNPYDQNTVAFKTSTTVIIDGVSNTYESLEWVKQ